MSVPAVCGCYRTPNGEHEVIAVRDAAGRWEVFDRAPAQITLVETLTGHDDRLDQAIALARDYAEEKQAYHDGRRTDDPLPRIAASAKVLDVA